MNFDKYQSSNGNYDGAAMLSDLSGLSKNEIRWTFDRLRHLIHVEGKTKEAAKVIVKNEAVNRPWEIRR